jgi:ABC-type sugar transport system permease subunit
MDGISWALLYFVLPIGLGTLVYIGIPWTRFFLEKGYLSLREKRIKELIDNFRWVKQRKEDSQYIVIRLVGLTIVYLLLVLAVPIFASIIINNFYEATTELKIIFILPWKIGLSLSCCLILLIQDQLRNNINAYNLTGIQK